VLGGHTHVRVFCSNGENRTYGKNGDVIFRNEEWEDFRDHFNAERAVFIDDDDLEKTR
jgi:hypothetical protein